VLQLAFSSEYPWLPRELELLDTAAERCLRVAEKARLVEDLARRERQVRQLSEHMMQIEEEERRRISRELHDEAGQSLLCIRLKLEMLGRSAPSTLQAPLEETRKLTEHTITEIRRIIGDLLAAVINLAAFLKHFLAGLVQGLFAFPRLFVDELAGFFPGLGSIQQRHRAAQDCAGYKPAEFPAFFTFCHLISSRLLGVFSILLYKWVRYAIYRKPYGGRY
jgi:hypothetical protein